MTFTVYGLIDPRTNRTRYIGYTSRDIERRLREHVHQARIEHHSHKCHWIRQLLAEGLKPEVRVLFEKGDRVAAFRAEVWSIALFRDAGALLTNVKDGGGGSPAYQGSDSRVHSAEFRARIRETATGRRHTEETKQRLSQLRAGRSQPPCTEEQKVKLSAALKGKPWSEARRQAQVARRAARLQGNSIEESNEQE